MAFFVDFLNIVLYNLYKAYGENWMKDPRISIRLTEKEHESLKIVAARKHKKIQQLMIG